MAKIRLNLKTEQPHLWQRVFAISLCTFLLGLPLLWAPSPSTPSANVSVMQNLLELKYHGLIFMGLSLTLFVSCFRFRKNYLMTRTVLAMMIGYSFMWLLSLLYGALQGEINSFAIVSLWALYSFFLLNTLKDPGFTISDLIREVRKHHDV